VSGVRSGAIVVVAASLAALVLPAGSAASCGAGYGYAGLEGAVPAGGVAATVALLSPPHVESGHVAAWVGVGGYGLGPGGTDEWLQVGVATRAGSPSRLYIEWKTPHRRARYRELPALVATGVGHRVAVRELGRGVWRAFVDGAPAGQAVTLPASHARLDPMAVAESWDGGRPVCNRFAYRFRAISVASPLGVWAPVGPVYRIADPGQRLVDRTPSGFTALAGS